MELMPNEYAMHDEWTAWRDACTELQKCGVDMNKQDELAAAFKLWGERLVALRLAQNDDVLYEARREAELKYTPPQYVIDAR